VTVPKMALHPELGRRVACYLGLPPDEAARAESLTPTELAELLLEAGKPEALGALLGELNALYAEREVARRRLDASVLPSTAELDGGTESLGGLSAEAATQLGLFRATIDSMGDGVLVVDHSGRMRLTNDAFIALWRIPEDVLARRDRHGLQQAILSLLKQPEDFVRRLEELSASDENSVEELELVDGRVFERYSQPMRVDGQVTGRLYVFRDVTAERRASSERQLLEEQLRQAQRMEAIGKLAGGIAHDFNNLLMAVSGYGELLLLRLPPEHRGRRDVAEILRASQRAAALTAQLLAFSRRQVLQPRVLDLNAAVAEIDSMLRRLIGEDVELQASLRAHGRVMADPSQLEQVLMNLVLNARDAMPRGGKLTIETADVELDAESASSHVELGAGSYVLLAVSDTGCGMDDEVRKHIFEPFFTTKEQGRGTGLGLSTVYGIVTQSGGQVTVYSVPGSGSTFKVYLQRVDAELTAPRAEAPPSRAAGGSETILLVEDEEVIRNVIGEVLRSRGYRVLAAQNGPEALQLAARHPGPIDLMVTDVVMPTLSGPELARCLAPIRPRTGVLYVSGYTDQAVVRHGVLAAGSPFLQKPFSATALVQKVREILDGTLAAP
jgi:signal transduction histidine kinase